MLTNLKVTLLTLLGHVVKYGLVALPALTLLGGVGVYLVLVVLLVDLNKNFGTTKDVVLLALGTSVGIFLADLLHMLVMVPLLGI